MKPELKSDALDLDIAAYVRNDYTRRSWINISLLLVILLNVFTLVGMVKLAVDTRDAVTAQIPGLKSQIRSRDKTISDQQDIIENQAVPQLLRLAEQVKNLGGDPGQITLRPPKD